VEIDGENRSRSRSENWREALLVSASPTVSSIEKRPHLQKGLFLKAENQNSTSWTGRTQIDLRVNSLCISLSSNTWWLRSLNFLKPILGDPFGFLIKKTRGWSNFTQVFQNTKGWIGRPFPFTKKKIAAHFQEGMGFSNPNLVLQPLGIGLKKYRFFEKKTELGELAQRKNFRSLRLYKNKKLA